MYTMSCKLLLQPMLFCDHLIWIGGIAAFFVVAALGLFGIIPIPVNWTNSICNATESYRNVFVTYENVTLDRPPFYNYSDDNSNFR